MGDRDLLVVEDDEAIGRGLCTALGAQRYGVNWCTSGRAAVDAAAACVYDLVLLDLGLPDVDGLDVCRRLRADHPAITIVVLTARTDEVHVVAGLDAGADDYLAKPFRLAELLARVRAHLRRPSGARPPMGEVLEVGGLRLDTGARRAWVGDIELDLRAKEYDLLSLLAGNAGRVVTREQIMFSVWDAHFFGSTKTLDMHVSALRRKLGDDPSVGITTLRGVGYRLDVP